MSQRDPYGRVIRLQAATSPLADTYSSNIDGRTEREIHLHPFMRAVQADVASIMCAYNLVNNSWACQNSEMMNNRLMTELGFREWDQKRCLAWPLA